VTSRLLRVSRLRRCPRRCPPVRCQPYPLWPCLSDVVSLLYRCCGPHLDIIAGDQDLDVTVTDQWGRSHIGDLKSPDFTSGDPSFDFTSGICVRPAASVTVPHFVIGPHRLTLCHQASSSCALSLCFMISVRSLCLTVCRSVSQTDPN
jgi:hypothetical protein